MEELPQPLIKLLEVLERFGAKAYLIGARALIMYGVLSRTTKDVDIMITIEDIRVLRDELTKELRKKGFNVQWRAWGLLVRDKETGLEIDINTPMLILDEEFERRSKAIARNLYLPSLEDLIVTKLMSLERKDYEDIKEIFKIYRKIDFEYLCRRIVQANLKREFNRIAGRLKVRKC
ncbi:nucleotidyltransferase [Pyrococcus kukulkanii]|uniref:nucleotidyltransferase n=1 Tax=Pyrococcus kukulkanii TaxID=1609559 RepID=UPI003564BA2F